MVIKVWPVREGETGLSEAISEPWQPDVVEEIPGRLLPMSTEEVEEQPRVPRVRKPSSPPKATPPMLKIGTLPDDRLRLRAPIEVQIDKEDDWYIAKCKQLSEFGYGFSPMAAVDDLRATLVELYWTLEEEQQKLGSDLAIVHKQLCGLIEQR